MSLVGILTAIDGVESSLVKNFSFMGANSFNIQNRSTGFSLGRNTKRLRYEPISYKEALEFKERYEYEGTISTFSNNSWSAIAKFKSEKTNPNTVIVGGDENYLRVSGYDLNQGRNLTDADVRLRNNVVLIGEEIRSQLFPTQNPIDRFIKIGGSSLRVVGVLESKGSAFDFGGDRVIICPISVARHHFPSSNKSYNIGVAVEDVMELNSAVEYSTALFRNIRKLRIKEEENFTIVKSDSLSQSLMENLSLIIMAAVLIATITLIGAAVALMNIMLVSVTERTKEIGIRKSIGAKPRLIMNQFILEAITICQLGGVGGIILGLVIGNLTSNYIGGSFIVPWNWMILAVVVCSVVGLAAGIWPAYKASKVDPIVALRYE